MLATILATEISLHLRWHEKVIVMRTLLSKTFWVLRSNFISDHYKERVVPIYSLRFAASSGILFIYLLLVILPFLVVSLFSSNYEVFLPSLLAPLNILLMIFASICYLFLRARL